MKLRRGVVLVVACVAALVLVEHPRAADTQLIAPGSVWRYNDSGTNLGTSWRTSSYNDSAWKTGSAQLGYGDGDEATSINFGSSTNRYITYYFRRAFSVSDPGGIAALTLRVLRDDGCVVYLNGVEVMRSNMPTGTISYTTRAPVAIGGADENAWNEVPVDPARLVAGQNVIAVEVHQQSPTSTDVSFDLELRATPVPAPASNVVLTSPADGAIINGTTQTFSATATAPAGLSSATLLIGGVPQTTTLSGQGLVVDAQITADTPSTPAPSGLSINVDGQTPHAHGLMKFPTVIGSGANQVPAGSTVVSAILTINCTNVGQAMGIYRLTQDWTPDQATWNERSSGQPWGAAGADGTASHAGVAVSGGCSALGQRTIDLTRFVQEWSDGQPNFGLVLTDGGTDGIDFNSSESAIPPSLAVTYIAPMTAIATQPVSGTSATIDFPATLPAMAAFTWNIEITDTAGVKRRAAANFSVTVDIASPNEPELIAPSNGATNVDPTAPLVARVSSPNGGTVTATAAIRPASGEAFTIIVLPDTQHYSEAFPGIFTAQTQWIAAQKTARNIVFVTHEGDIVQNYNNTTEWQRANTSMSILDGVVPYGMAPGNHDQPSTLYNQYFPFTRYLPYAWYGGHYGSLNDNNFQLFSGGGIDFVSVHLEFCPPAAVVAWAKSVFDSFPNRIGTMTTHGYLNESAQRTVHGCADTSYLWNNLGAITPNLHFMLSGHVHDESRRTDMANGHPVFQMLADYQDRASGGEGWLRIMRFVPSEDKVYVQTYSPWLDRFETDANSEFSLDFTMSSPFAVSAPSAVPSGSNASFAANGLQPGKKYEWRVTVTNEQGRTRTGPLWTFTTMAGPVNQAPTALDATLGLNEDSSLGVTALATDPENQALTYTLVSGPSNGTLTGTLPNVTYQPAANFAGTDSFTFRVSDGELTSAPATITLVVSPVNDAPTASGDSYSVATNGTLNVNAPGVLANDSDVDGTALSTVVVSGPANGSLSLAANGSFAYTPTPGFIGTDAFTYSVTDGTLSSAPVTVTITVVGVPAGPIFTANFTSGSDSFTYVDNTFRGTSQGSYASGSWVSSGGFSGGALRIYLGGVNDSTINNMSGGWRRSFSLNSAASISLTFRYRVDQGPDYESDEISQMLASIDGALVSGVATDYIAQIAGNGNGGSSIETGWRQVTINLGTLSAGSHTLTLGGFNNKKTTQSERTTIWIDEVSVVIK